MLRLLIPERQVERGNTECLNRRQSLSGRQNCFHHSNTQCFQSCWSIIQTLSMLIPERQVEKGNSECLNRRQSLSGHQDCFHYSHAQQCLNDSLVHSNAKRFDEGEQVPLLTIIQYH